MEHMHEVTGEKMGVPESSHVYRPRFDLKSSDLPELKDWPVGEHYILVLDVKLVGLHEYDEGNEKKIQGDFEIHKIGDLSDASAKQLEKVIAKAKES